VADAELELEAEEDDELELELELELEAEEDDDAGCGGRDKAHGSMMLAPIHLPQAKELESVGRVSWADSRRRVGDVHTHVSE
jgi:hypothetical protein